VKQKDSEIDHLTWQLMLKEDDYNKIKEEKDNIQGVYDEIGKLSTVLLDDDETPGLQ
jgi:hypothetical protein